MAKGDKRNTQKNYKGQEFGPKSIFSGGSLDKYMESLGQYKKQGQKR